MHAEHLQATHSAPIVLVGLADARSKCPRFCRPPKPKGKWALPFEIVRLHPERPSLIKPRPAHPFLWTRWTGQECDRSALSRRKTQPCAQVYPCQRVSASRDNTDGKSKKMRQLALPSSFHVQDTAQQVEAVPCARVQKIWDNRGANNC